VESIGHELGIWLAVAWLLPLLGFFIEIFGGYWGTRLSKTAAHMAVVCIATGFVCSSIAFVRWGAVTDWAALELHAPVSATHFYEEPNAAKHSGHGSSEAATAIKKSFSGQYYQLALFGDLEIAIDYYIDSLTLVMFMMVTLVATCIHIFALGYMSDELTDDHIDHEVHLANGSHMHRPGRYYRFFSYMSLFCFSMLGLVLAGNIFMVFVFWELVGICSYLLIGFYTERHSASTAANKAFIVNRVGDFGFIIGLMIIWTWCGTFQFYEYDSVSQSRPGLFQMVRTADGQLDREGDVVYLQDGQGHRLVNAHNQQPIGIEYMLLVAAGIGIFAGCVGKSAQFPLQTWLPDAMEGPTPVSALVHSATMVAAGVYLAGRFFPIFTPEVLLTIAYVGCITLFVAATIAIVATDIKRVLAYSTISQLGYMMLAIGVAGWVAGLFHLITHAFFKSLMFLCSGSVIIGCHHEQEMTRMGGLWRKMPVTAFTMLVGVIAISGLAIPGVIAFSGYHSKDAIMATSLAFFGLNSSHFLLYFVPLITAGITAFYMFRLWFYTFLGEPRDQELHEHVHEQSWVMTGPLVVLAVFAAFCAVGGEHGYLFRLLADSEPAGIAAGTIGVSGIALPTHKQVGAVHMTAGAYALVVACLGTLMAYAFYGIKILNPEDVKRQFAGVYRFLVQKWQFDKLYDVMFVKPAHIIAGWCVAIDRGIIDAFLHRTVKTGVDVSNWDRRFDEVVIDGLVNSIGNVTFAFGRSLRVLQTGLLRQYVMFIAIGVVGLFLLLFVFFPK